MVVKFRHSLVPFLFFLIGTYCWSEVSLLKFFADMNLNTSDAKHLLALTIFSESRNEGSHSQLMTGLVILNRVKFDENFDSNLKNEIVNSGFSAWLFAKQAIKRYHISANDLTSTESIKGDPYIYWQNKRTQIEKPLKESLLVAKRKKLSRKIISKIEEDIAGLSEAMAYVTLFFFPKEYAQESGFQPASVDNNKPKSISQEWEKIKLLANNLYSLAKPQTQGRTEEQSFLQKSSQLFSEHSASKAPKSPNSSQCTTDDLSHLRKLLGDNFSNPSRSKSSNLRLHHNYLREGRYACDRNITFQKFQNKKCVYPQRGIDWHYYETKKRLTWEGQKALLNELDRFVGSKNIQKKGTCNFFEEE